MRTNFGRYSSTAELKIDLFSSLGIYLNKLHLLKQVGVLKAQFSMEIILNFLFQCFLNREYSLLYIFSIMWFPVTFDRHTKACHLTR